MKDEDIEERASDLGREVYIGEGRYVALQPDVDALGRAGYLVRLRRPQDETDKAAGGILRSCWQGVEMERGLGGEGRMEVRTYLRLSPAAVEALGVLIVASGVGRKSRGSYERLG